ncbi:hypothetical protein R6Q59_012322 [Mikania micrantha]
MAPKQWTHDEETAIGKCYMDEFENKTKGNSQKRENFWKKVTVTWHNMMGFDAEYCTYHQLNSKWKDMCTKLTKFSWIYSNCANNRKSGMSDENVLKWAEKEYQLKSNGQTFNHYHVWVAIKDSPKFRVLCQKGYEVQCSSKRTKNSVSNEYSPGGSTAHTNYAVNLEDDEEEAEFDTPRNRLDRQGEIQQNGIPLRVVKPSPLTRQQSISLINSKISQLFKNKNTRIGKKCTKKSFKFKKRRLFEPTSEQWSLCLPKNSTRKNVK